MPTVYPILWPSLQKVQQLYRGSSSQSQIFCKFKSTTTDKFLNIRKPTLRNTDGTIFEITSIGWVLVHGEYLKVNTVDSNGDVVFETSAEPDVFWDGNHLISREKNKALDIYDIYTNNVKLWTYNGHENQKWLQVNIATTLQPNIQPSLEDLVGKRVSGTVAQTGPNYFALLVEQIEGITSSSLGTQLVQMARQYLKDRNMTWNVNTPRSWTIPVSPQRQLGPHISLSSSHFKDVHKQFTLTIVGVMHWEENSRWVALKLKGPLIDHTNWILHLSCAQQIM